MLDDDVLRALAANCGRAYVAGASAVGRPWQVEDDLMLSDLGLPIAVPPNNATLLREPGDEASTADVVARAAGFFAAAPGGGYQVWSLWPSLDLAPFGLRPFDVPCMIRETGGEARPAPAGLEVAEVEDDAGMHEVWRVVDDVFTGGLVPEPAWDARLLREDYRVWLGRVDGRAVTTATASISDGFVGVYAVATLPQARGHGYAEAVSWAATLCRPDLPATLQASPMGLPVYERMGFATIAAFRVWEGDRAWRG
ncbi:MAG TPA: hypothetical protein VE669_07310 [Actinomycetota bacterium]|jgi:GNAT superfamily N-acetyltransferase|nr:hypothetical protein [Actinomycetota bacterium]